MSESLKHYGVQGMKWGVRKQYEGTGRSGGGGWGPNVAGGGGPSPLAASMAGNPKKKKRFGKKVVEKMGLTDQERLVKSIKKDPAKASEELEKRLDPKKMVDLKSKHSEMNTLMKEAANDFDKQDEYDEEYYKKALEWSIEDLKKNYPDTYEQCVKDAKAEGFDVSDHKIVRYNSDGYPEPYNPPETDKTRAADKAFNEYYETCRDITRELIGDHGYETINTPGYPSTVAAYVDRFLDEHSK